MHPSRETGTGSPRLQHCQAQFIPKLEGIPARLPSATFELFEKSGHQPFFEEPDRFATAVTDWFAAETG